MTYSLPHLHTRSADVRRERRRFEDTMTLLRQSLGRRFVYGLVEPLVRQTMEERPHETPMGIGAIVTILLQKSLDFSPSS